MAGTQTPAPRLFLLMRRSVLWTLILLWLIGILFPMAFLGSRWPALGAVFESVFAPNWMHLLMHGFLYAVLGLLLALGLRPVCARHFFMLAGLVLLVACLHEALQLWTAGMWPGWSPELYDLLVDLAGAALGVGIWKIWQRRE